MKKQVTPPSPKSMGSSISEQGRLSEGRPNIASDKTEVHVRYEEREIVLSINNQVLSDEVKGAENVLLDGPVIRPSQERPNTDGIVRVVTGLHEQQEISRSMKRQVCNTPPSPTSVISSITEEEPKSKFWMVMSS